ncbi:uncharacterized protein F4822DRAFT_1146 [Hypoxylon trugodes]|uniref:uncharacterized protein n=1 Tax=Hypoxylon trugodes TaxID=326681 RepID=UPI00218E0795|nr:uncharacterized protein F4822DRAFT_1146 [Hypoxylon trugodes]KAI1393130.1 hypothetical protein F4822DRAFT_1146 [Hypoxylon trugodes]
MPRYTSPSVSPTSRARSPSPTRSRRRSLSTHSKPFPLRASSPAHSDSGKDVLKTSLVFLGVVGAASLAASKYWPKGILYGEKESWAQEAKEEVKHVMHGDKHRDRESRGRPRSAGHGDREMRHRRQPRVEIRDEVIVRRPDGRSMYLDTGWTEQPYDGRRERDRRRIVDTRDSRRSSDEPYYRREHRGLSQFD